MISEETIQNLQQKKFKFIFKGVLGMTIYNAIFPILRFNQYYERELYWILAYQFVWVIIAFVFLYLMHIERMKKHRFQLYFVFCQLALIRLSIPLLDFEDRKSFMSPIEMSNFLFAQSSGFLLIFEAGVFLDFNKCLLLVNVFISTMVVAFGNFQLFNDGVESMLTLFFKHSILILILFVSFSCNVILLMISNGTYLYQLLRIFYDKNIQ